MIIASDFVDAFPEFMNVAIFPTASIDFWITQAYNQLNATFFGTTLDLAAMLFVAHNIVLSARSARVAEFGGIPGEATGPINSKGVGAVHVGYGTLETAMAGAGAWNATLYGQRLYRMMVAVEAGGMYVPPACNIWPSSYWGWRN